MGHKLAAVTEFPVSGKEFGVESRLKRFRRFSRFSLLTRILVFLLLIAGMSRAQGNSPLAYALTAPTDPVRPGQVVEFDVTVTNPSSSGQNTALYFTVPVNTTYGSDGAGKREEPVYVSLQPGQSQTQAILLTVVVGNLAPPDGTTIGLTVTDQNNGVSFSRNVVVRQASPLNLSLSTSQASVAPGQEFSYGFSCSNPGGAGAAGAVLRVPVPAGTTFVAADNGGALGGDGVVQWSLGALGAGANEQVHLTLAASSTAQVPSLIPIEAQLTDSGGDICRASDSKLVNSAPPLGYSITVPTDPVKPGQVVEFDVTVTNVSSSQQSAYLYFTVPGNTTYGTDGAGTRKEPVTSYLQPGQSYTQAILLTVAGGNLTPPDGTTIGLTVTDQNNGVSFSRNVVVRQATPLNLSLSTSQASVAPGQEFSYGFSCSTPGSSGVAGAVLRVPVPAGTTFVTADNGGALGGDGVVQWSLGALGAGANEQVHLTLAANSTAQVPSLIPIEAQLTDSGGDICGASDSKLVNSAPLLGYSITVPVDPVKPGQVAEFDVTVTNISSSQQYAYLYFTVPGNTTYGSDGAGKREEPVYVSLQPGQSQTQAILLTVAGGNLTPPDGTTIGLTVADQNNGLSFSRNVVVRQASPLNLSLSTSQASVAPGQEFSYGLSCSNPGGGGRGAAGSGACGNNFCGRR